MVGNIRLYEIVMDVYKSGIYHVFRELCKYIEGVYKMYNDVWGKQR